MNPCTWTCYFPKPDVGKSQLLLSAVVCDDSIFQVSGCKVSSSNVPHVFFSSSFFFPFKCQLKRRLCKYSLLVVLCSSRLGRLNSFWRLLNQINPRPEQQILSILSRSVSAFPQISRQTRPYDSMSGTDVGFQWTWIRYRGWDLIIVFCAQS